MSNAAQKIPAVAHDHEFARIAALPRRRYEDISTQIPDYRTEQGRREGCAPRDLQAKACNELYHHGGLFAALPVGAGKTWISWVAALVRQSRRPHLFMPASLSKHKTPKEFAALSKQWVSNQPIPHLHSYTELTLDKNVDLLERLNPDLLILDEAHKLRNIDGSAATRLDRYIMSHPELVVVVMTGTIMRKSISDFAHLLRWTHRGNCPVPIDPHVLWTWCQALDEEAGLGRWEPGPLLQFDPYPEFASAGILARARNGVQRRIRETPGVIIIDEDFCKQPLEIILRLPPPDEIIDQHFKNFRETWEAPDGWPMTAAIQTFTHVRQLGCGMYSKHVPRPPEQLLTDPARVNGPEPYYVAQEARLAAMGEPEKRPTYITARREVSRFIKREIENSRNSDDPKDTDKMVRAANKGHPLLTMWERVEPTFQPDEVTEWFSGSIVYAVVQWCEYLKSIGEKGIVWCKFKEVAASLSQVSGIPYFGSGGMLIRDGKKTKQSIEDPISQSGCAILSIDANLEGRNLQVFHRALIIGWEQSAERIEQLIGREHRYGQEHPVTIEVLLTSGETLDSFGKTLAEARFVHVQQGHTQKILRAKITRVRLPDSPRWDRPSDGDM